MKTKTNLYRCVSRVTRVSGELGPDLQTHEFPRQMLSSEKVFLLPVCCSQRSHRSDHQTAISCPAFPHDSQINNSSPTNIRFRHCDDHRFPQHPGPRRRGKVRSPDRHPNQTPVSMRLCTSPRKPVVSFPIVVLNGQRCLPRHLIPKPLSSDAKDFDLEKFLKEFNQRRRYEAALRVMEQDQEKEQEDGVNSHDSELRDEPIAATSDASGSTVRESNTFQSDSTSMTTANYISRTSCTSCTLPTWSQSE